MTRGYNRSKFVGGGRTVPVSRGDNAKWSSMIQSILLVILLALIFTPSGIIAAIW